MDDVTVQTDDVAVDIEDGYVSADVSGDMYSDDGYMSSEVDYMMDDGGLYTETGMPTQDVDPAAVATIAGFGLIMSVIGIGIFILMIVSMWKIFVKAGQPGWASIIPIYNTIVWLQMINKPLWWIVLLFIPFVNIILFIMMYHELSKAFGKGVGYTIGMLLFSYIFFPMLAFGSAVYTKPMQPVMQTPTTPTA